jgi:hypothetical protein
VLPAELVPRHNAPLEARLRELHAEKLDRVRRELILEIEQERDEARQRAAQQRRELRIDVVPPDEGEASDGTSAAP